MKKVGIALLAAASIVGFSAQSAQAAEITGPCAKQQELFEKYNIQIDMYFPLFSDTYNAVGRVTG